MDEPLSAKNLSVTSPERVVISNTKKSMTLKIAITAIMTAMVCVSTLLIRIPIPATNGYFNIGESMIFITALLLGSYFGGFAGGVGSALADLISGYFLFAPITFIVKGLEGLIVGWIYHKFLKSTFRYHIFAQLLAILCGAPIMILGYFLSEYFILMLGNVAILEIPFNIVQALVGLLIAIPVSLFLEKNSLIQNLQS